MGLAVALSLALITQPGTTQILQVDGSVKQFQLYWDFEGELILELNGATVTQINGAAPPNPSRSLSSRCSSTLLRPSRLAILTGVPWPIRMGPPS